eukprot:15473786-Alexandrium_andersonii.AAC.1
MRGLSPSGASGPDWSPFRGRAVQVQIEAATHARQGGLRIEAECMLGTSPCKRGHRGPQRANNRR